MALCRCCGSTSTGCVGCASRFPAARSKRASRRSVPPAASCCEETGYEATEWQSLGCVRDQRQSGMQCRPFVSGDWLPACHGTSQRRSRADLARIGAAGESAASSRSPRDRSRLARCAGSPRNPLGRGCCRPLTRLRTVYHSPHDECHVWRKRHVQRDLDRSRPRVLEQPPLQSATLAGTGRIAGVFRSGRGAKVPRRASHSGLCRVSRAGRAAESSRLDAASARTR